MTQLNRNDPRTHSICPLFDVEDFRQRPGEGFCNGDKFTSVVKLEDGSLSYLIEVVVPGGIMNPGFLRIFYSITKQEYRELLAKAKANGFLENTGKHRQPTLEELEAIGRE